MKYIEVCVVCSNFRLDVINSIKQSVYRPFSLTKHVINPHPAIYLCIGRQCLSKSQLGRQSSYAQKQLLQMFCAIPKYKLPHRDILKIYIRTCKQAVSPSHYRVKVIQSDIAYRLVLWMLTLRMHYIKDFALKGCSKIQ